MELFTLRDEPVEEVLVGSFRVVNYRVIPLGRDGERGVGEGERCFM